MEISPVREIRPLAAVEPQRDDPRLSAIFDIEGSSEPHDDAFTQSGRNGATGQDDEPLAMEETPESTEPADPDTAHSTVNLFA